jgi:hypothetical protein
MNFRKIYERSHLTEMAMKSGTFSDSGKVQASFGEAVKHFVKHSKENGKKDWSKEAYIKWCKETSSVTENGKDLEINKSVYSPLQQWFLDTWIGKSMDTLGYSKSELGFNPSSEKPAKGTKKEVAPPLSEKEIFANKVWELSGVPESEKAVLMPKLKDLIDVGIKKFEDFCTSKGYPVDLSKFCTPKQEETYKQKLQSLAQEINGDFDSFTVE